MTKRHFLLLCALGAAGPLAAQTVPMFSRIKGRFYLFADDIAKLFLNGQEIAEARWRSGAANVFQSKEVELAPDDRLFLQLENRGKAKGAILAFLSTDRRFAVSFRAADFKIVLDRTNKNLAARDIEALTRAAEPISYEHEKNPLPIANASEWLWGTGDSCAIATVMRKEMIQPFGK